MIFPLYRLPLLALCLLLPLFAGAQTAPLAEAPAAAPAASPSEPQASPPPAPASEGCRPLTDKAVAADMRAVTAQSQKRELAEQARLYDEALLLWAQVVSQCDGRARERAQRNLADSQKASATISEQMGAGPQCAAAHKDASALQELARQALGERRWSEASLLFRKAENMWDLASERCTGSQQEVATRRRDQSEIDGHNAEVCAPLFDKAREQTQKLRASAAGLSREDKQEASMVAETLWRDALALCKGSAVQDAARNNAQALARERGTPWVARVAPAAAPKPAPLAAPAGDQNSKKSEPLPEAPTPLASPAAGSAAAASVPAAAGAGVAPPAALSFTLAAPATLASSALPLSSAPAVPDAQPAAFSDGTTRLSGQFTRDADSATYSGSGKVVWANGDVFEGSLLKGQRHGRGLFIWASGQRYNGDWVKDKSVGQGSIQFVNGNLYEGAVIDGVPQGRGQMRYASGDSYSGQFRAGGPEGVGLYVWKNGQQFEGEWRQERPNGQGKLRFANGNQYEGSVVDGVPEGEGRMLFASGDSYAGQFARGEPHGQGTFSWGNGDSYTGQWKAGKKHGLGKFSWKSGDIWEGVYEDDQQTAAK